MPKIFQIFFCCTKQTDYFVHIGILINVVSVATLKSRQISKQLQAMYMHELQSI